MWVEGERRARYIGPLIHVDKRKGKSPSVLMNVSKRIGKSPCCCRDRRGACPGAPPRRCVGWREAHTSQAHADRHHACPYRTSEHLHRRGARRTGTTPVPTACRAIPRFGRQRSSGRRARTRTRHPLWAEVFIPRFGRQHASGWLALSATCRIGMIAFVPLRTFRLPGRPGGPTASSWSPRDA